MKRSKFAYAIFALYLIGQYSSNVSCAPHKSEQEISSLKSELPKVESKDKSKELDLTTTVDDATKEERNSRSIFGSSRHLRVGSSNCDSDNDESNIVGATNDLTKENNSGLSENEDTVNSADSLVGLPYIPTVHTPYIPRLHRPTIPRLNPLYHPILPTLPVLPHTPLRGSILRSVLHPRLHPHINRLHMIPGTLLRAAALPIHGLIQAQSHLHQLLPTLPLNQGVQDSVVGSAKPLEKGKDTPLGDLGYSNEPFAPVLGAYPTTFNSKPLSTHLVHSNYFPHLQPTGYVVRFIPHSRTPVVGSPIVGSPSVDSPTVGSPQQSTNCLDNNTNTKETVGSVNIKEDKTREDVKDKTGNAG